MTNWVAIAKRNHRQLFALLEQLVRIESPTSDREGNNNVAALLEGHLAQMGAAVSYDRQAEFGDHLVATWPGKGKHALVIGHIDTVWPVGTLNRMGYTESGGRIYGPGVHDMKGGIAASITAFSMLRAANAWPSRPVRFIANSDEERGSPSSRALIERYAKGAAYVLVMEPSDGPRGALRLRRKGVGEFRVVIKGKAAHAGLNPHKGASAVLEMARQIEVMEALSDREAGANVNVGLVRGGSARNTIPAHAEALVDVRVPDNTHAARIGDAILALEPTLPGTRISVKGGFHRPPMDVSPETERLYSRVRSAARDMGFDVPMDRRIFGGGSDANLTAAMGVPTLDGLGTVGENPHAERENIVADELVNRTALLARMLSEL